MFGRSMFGDSVFGASVGAQVPDPSAPVRVPVGGTFPVDTTTSSLIPVDQTMSPRKLVGNVNVPTGAMVGVGERSRITATQAARIGIMNDAPKNLTIGRMRDPRPNITPDQEQRYWDAWMEKYYPGVFHRPAYVGGDRYAATHPGGLPVLGFAGYRRHPAYAMQGYQGYSGLGSPDGLIGIGGFGTDCAPCRGRR